MLKCTIFKPTYNLLYAPVVQLESTRSELANRRFMPVTNSAGKTTLRALPKSAPYAVNTEAISTKASAAPDSTQAITAGSSRAQCPQRSFLDSENRAIHAYLVYYNRPADPAGLEFWSARLATEENANGTIIRAFGASEEFERRFGDLDTEALVANVYRQLFDRSPDPASLHDYAGKIKSGRLSREELGLKMVVGVSGVDRQVFDNRMQASRLYTATAESVSQREIPAAVLSDLLHQVTADPASIDRACARIATLFEDTRP